MKTSERSLRPTSLMPISGLAASPAKTSPSPASGQVSEEREAVSGLISQPWWNSVDPNGLSSRMWPDFSLPTEGQTWPSSSGSFPASGMAWRGECLILDTLESPNDAVASTLSDILETSVPQRFFLSTRAATGILRRAERRGRTLPTALQQALEAVAAGMGKDGTPPTPSVAEDQVSGWKAKQPMLSEPPMGITAIPAHEETAQTTLWPFSQPKQVATDGESSKMAPSTHRQFSVRRLTPTECERLQGFPDGWTLPDTAPLGTP